MNLDWITTFLDILETGNFNLTAERLNLRQSTVSHRIRLLEEALGVQLFVRGRAGAKPTDEALRFETHARNLRHEWNSARRIGKSDDLIKDELRIGIQYDLAQSRAGEFVAALRQQFPNTAFYVEVDYSQQMNADVESGALDAALIYTPNALPDLYCEEIGLSEYVMVSDQLMHFEDVARENYIFPNISASFAQEHQRRLPDLEHALLSCGQSEALVQFIQNLGGASFVARDIVKEKIEREELFAVEGAPHIQQRVYFVCHLKNRNKSEQLKMKKVAQAVISRQIV